jgi:glutathione S-transferase
VVEVPITKPGKYRHVSPTGKFPAIVHDRRTIVDSTDILRYLDTTFPAARVAPDGPRDAALAAILEDWADESLYFYDLTMRAWPQNRAWFIGDLLHNAPPGFARTMLGKLIPGALLKVTKAQGLGRKSDATVVADLSRLFDALEALLMGQDWLAGPRLSSGDISVRVMVNVLERTVEGRAMMAARPGLAAWAARVDAAAPPVGVSVTAGRAGA